MLLMQVANAILFVPKALGLGVCHSLSSLANRNVAQTDSRIVAGVFNDASTRILTLYVITNRRGSAQSSRDGLDGVRKSTWLSRERLMEGRSPIPLPVLLQGLGNNYDKAPTLVPQA